MITLGRINLKKFKIEQGLNSTEMAEKVGITRQHYSNLECGKCNPSYELLEAFEKVFNLDAKDVWLLFKKF